MNMDTALREKKINLNLFKMSGFWQILSKDSIWWVAAHAIPMAYFVFYMQIVQLARLIITHDDLKLEEFVERFVCIASYIDGTVKVFYFLANRKLARHLAEVFEKEFLLCSKFETDLRAVRRGQDLSKMACTFFCILIFSTSLIWILTPLIQCLFFERCLYLKVIPTWFPFDQSEGFKKTLAYLLDSATVGYNALIIFTGNAWVITLIVMVCAQMNLLKSVIANIRVIAEDQVNVARNNAKYGGNNKKFAGNNKEYAKNNEKYELKNAKYDSDFVNYANSNGKNEANYEKKNENFEKNTAYNEKNYQVAENFALDKDVRNKMDELLKVCLNDHQKLLRTIGLMEKLLSPVNLFQMIVSSIMVCSTVFVMIIPFALKSKRGDNGALDKMMKHGVKYSFFCADAILELGIFSFSGLMISEQTKSMHRVFYNSDWQNASKSYKKNVLFATTRAAVPLTLTAGKFYNVDLQSFASILKISYSCLMLLYGLVSKRQSEFQM
ncbi:hypothetical protein LSTR_LSTR012813 [Laodelphax striatellus]|uniref:Odorant receptor n=1 Tax=Laodelphax striatellus TaxID=195883 RepID=A0A482WRE7_LAOST|nr:hypothetical protein LSTR_LSTR012813 [Laodelphax striatellus]